MHSSNITPSRRDEHSTRPAWQTRALAVVAAIVVNVVILAVGRLITGDYPVATTGGDDQSIGFAMVIFVTAIAGLVAWGLLVLLERSTSRAATIWTAIAIIVFVLSLFGPIAGDGTASKVVLACLHVGAAATIIPLMRSSAT